MQSIKNSTVYSRRTGKRSFFSETLSTIWHHFCEFSSRRVGLDEICSVVKWLNPFTDNAQKFFSNPSNAACHPKNCPPFCPYVFLRTWKRGPCLNPFMNSKIVIHGSSYFVQNQSFVEAVCFFLRSCKSCLVFNFLLYWRQICAKPIADRATDLVAIKQIALLKS